MSFVSSTRAIGLFTAIWMNKFLVNVVAIYVLYVIHVMTIRDIIAFNTIIKVNLFLPKSMQFICVIFSVVYCSTIDRMSYQHAFHYNCYCSLCIRKKPLKFANSSTFGLMFMGPPQYSHSILILTFSTFAWKCLFCLLSCCFYNHTLWNLILEKVPFDIREKKLKARIDKRKQFKTHYKKLTSEAKTDREQSNLSQNREHQYQVMNSAEYPTYFATELNFGLHWYH